MRLLKLSMSVLLLAGLIPGAWADDEYQCPSVSALKAAGVNYVYKHDGYFAVTTYGKYDTDLAWGFGLTHISASSKAEALVKSNTALSSLSFKKGPIVSTILGVVACYYKTSAGYEAVALTTTI